MKELKKRLSNGMTLNAMGFKAAEPQRVNFSFADYSFHTFKDLIQILLRIREDVEEGFPQPASWELNQETNWPLVLDLGKSKADGEKYLLKIKIWEDDLEVEGVDVQSFKEYLKVNLGIK
jgi:hypothetical protein